MTLRLLRFVLSKGTYLVLAINVFDETLSPQDFAALYRERWHIEEAFKLIKARLQVENFSGVLPDTVEQDFCATLVRSNCAAALALAACPEAASLGTPPVNARGWRVKLNRTLALKSLRHYLPRLLALNPAATLERLMQRLRASHALERTRPGRSSPRKERVRLAEFHVVYKAA
ncbi:MAG TPA: transposase [Accumulibacter sp.]|uniref:transposase n=1 Tax=Pseudomonadota TaxID=1224 RepID=UPI002BDE98AA|nr:transposase [Accumulibacter sp.]HMW57561.1 transposase [Accumulibacter sp.]